MSAETFRVTGAGCGCGIVQETGRNTEEASIQMNKSKSFTTRRHRILQFESTSVPARCTLVMIVDRGLGSRLGRGCISAC
jgi:hypothetical protein